MWFSILKMCMFCFSSRTPQYWTELRSLTTLHKGVLIHQSSKKMTNSIVKTDNGRDGPKAHRFLGHYIFLKLYIFIFD